GLRPELGEGAFMSGTATPSAAVRRLVRVLAPLPWLILVLGAAVAIALGGPAEGPRIRMTLVVTMAALFLALLARLLLVAVTTPARRLPLLVLAAAIALWATGSATVSAGQTVTAVTFPAPGELLCFVAYLGLAAYLLLDVPRGGKTAHTVWL